MQHSDAELLYSFHVQTYKPFITSVNGQEASYFTQQAQEMHALVIWGASQEVIFKGLSLATKVRSEKAKAQLQFGLGRRSQTIWQSFRSLHQIAPPSRTEPLDIDEGTESSTMLNTIYLNLRGAMDNLAWTLHHIIPSNQLVHDRDIGLFNRKYLHREGYEQVRKIVEPFMAWNNKLKSRRDPAAHRIPLAMVPAFLDPKAQEQFRNLDAQIGAKFVAAGSAATARDHSLSESLFLEIDVLRNRQSKLGTFRPCFAHDFANGLEDVYPTVPEDIGAYVTICRHLFEFMESRNA